MCAGDKEHPSDQGRELSRVGRFSRPASLEIQKSFPPGLARPAAHETSATRGAVLPGKFLPSQKTLSRRKLSEFRSTEISCEISHEVGNIRWAKARFCAAPTESARSGRAEQSSRRPQKFHTTNHFGEDRAQINLLASRRHFPL